MKSCPCEPRVHLISTVCPVGCTYCTLWMWHTFIMHDPTMDVTVTLELMAPLVLHVLKVSWRLHIQPHGVPRSVTCWLYGLCVCVCVCEWGSECICHNSSALCKFLVHIHLHIQGHNNCTRKWQDLHFIIEHVYLRLWLVLIKTECWRFTLLFTGNNAWNIMAGTQVN